MTVEHKYNIKIAELKIKKLELDTYCIFRTKGKNQF